MGQSRCLGILSRWRNCRKPGFRIQDSGYKMQQSELRGLGVNSAPDPRGRSEVRSIGHSGFKMQSPVSQDPKRPALIHRGFRIQDSGVFIFPPRFTGLSHHFKPASLDLHLEPVSTIPISWHCRFVLPRFTGSSLAQLTPSYRGSTCIWNPVSYILHPESSNPRYRQMKRGFHLYPESCIPASLGGILYPVSYILNLASCILYLVYCIH
jgi:hypothetical protein